MLETSAEPSRPALRAPAPRAGAEPTSPTDLRVAWHSLSAEEALALLDSDPTGIDKAEAAIRRARYGENRIAAPPGRSAVTRFLLQFNNVLIYVLIAAAAITLVLGHLSDASVIAAVVVVNAAIGFIQEGRAEAAMGAIRAMLAPAATVLRSGRRQSIDAAMLVPGDIVAIEPGDRISADMRILHARGLTVDEAILTGESVPAEKQTVAVGVDAVLAERASMVYSGTLATAGQGLGLVVATGALTEIGRISGMLAAIAPLTTPLVAQMAVLSRWLTLLILAAAGLLLLHGTFVAGYSFPELFLAVVGLSVAAIPEGLPAVLTITLAVGVQAMAGRNAIVRRLPAIETIGAVSVICTDKTGTLTRNEMMVATVIAAGRIYQLDGEGYEPRGRVSHRGREIDPSTLDILQEIACASALCNDAGLRNHAGAWIVEGDPMEGALLAFAGKAGFGADEQMQRWVRTDAIPFDARHRYMATLNHDHDGNGAIFVKGAPEAVLGMCRDERSADGTYRPLDLAFWRGEADAIARRGQRLLAIAFRVVEANVTILEAHELSGSLTLLGLVGLIDPPRAEAISAVAACRQAGIAVKMITGDHAATAEAIAREVGLARSHPVLSGMAIEAMDDPALARAVLDCDVFARTAPEHKLRLVRALQSQGLVVAMTGDGVNDAPALKRADIGIAMGRKGSEAAKEAAALVLADDNFASIVAAVREGRTVFDNIRKVIGWSLPTNIGEALTLVVALLLGATMPVTPVQILWVNLVTSVTLGVALAFEPTEAATMARPPRPRDEALLTGRLVWQTIWLSLLIVCGVFGIFAYAEARGYAPAVAQTMAVNQLVVFEIASLFFMRKLHDTALTLEAMRGTRVIWVTIAAVTAAQIAITYLPFMQTVFGTASVLLADGLVILALGVAFTIIVEIERQVWFAVSKPPRGA